MPFLDIYRGRVNPVENALSGMLGVEEVFDKSLKYQAAQDLRREQNKLRQVMQGQDWKNPDWNPIMKVAPIIGMKYMQTLGQLNNQQRLLATEKAKEGMEYFTTSLGRLRAEPGSRQEVMDNLGKLGVDPALIGLIPKFNGNLGDWQQAIDVMIAPIQGLQRVAVQSNFLAKRELAKEQHGYRESEIKTRTEGQLQVEDKKIAIENLKKTGKPGIYQDESGAFHEVRIGAQGGMIDTPMPKGWKPYKPGVEGGAKGKAKGKAETPEELFGRLDKEAAGGGGGFKPGTYKDDAGKLHYITTQEQYDELNK